MIKFKVLKNIADFINKNEQIEEKEILMWFNRAGLNCLIKDGYLKEITQKKEQGIIQMSEGKIYFVSYGSTQMIVRYKKSDTCNHHYNDCLHYWNGYESYYHYGYFVKSGIEEIREASDSEKYSLFKNSVEYHNI